MVIFLLQTVILLCCSTLPVGGQCGLSSIKEDSESGIDEYVFYILTELGQKLTTLQERVSSLGGCETVDPSSIEKTEELKENYQKLKMTFQNLSDKIDRIDGKLQATNACLRTEIQKRNSAIDHCRGSPSLCDCSSIRANGFRTSGVYRVYVEHQNQRNYFDVYCDMTTTPNVGWTVFQRRKDGSEKFYRGWNEYANGFGNPQGEFWLGNDFLHYVTSSRRYRLRIELEEFGGEKRYAEYSVFNISSAGDKYKLTIGSYSGDAGDSLVYHNGSKFSTWDQDNDGNPNGNCPVTRRGAWWYVYCHYSNLNGLYYEYGNYSNSRTISGNGIEWYHWRNMFGFSLKTTEMKLAVI